MVKMDVEGAEYDLLVHLILNNAAQFIDLMAIEYHKDVSFLKTPEQVLNFMLKTSGVRLAKWV